MTVQQAIATLAGKGYYSEAIDDGKIRVQDPVWVSSGTAVGRFVEFKAVVLTPDQVAKFIDDRS